MSSKINTNFKQQRTLHGGLRIPKEQQRKGGGQSRNGERWDEKGPRRKRSTLSRALLFTMCTCGWKNPASASVVISPPAGAHLCSWDLWNLRRESPPGPRLTPFCNWSPRPPPAEPFNKSWHLAEAGIEARPFNGSRSQKVLASQEHRFCPCASSRICHASTGLETAASYGQRCHMWLETLGVSTPELCWRAEQGCSVQSPGPLPGLGTLSVFCTGDAVWTAKESTSEGHQLEGESQPAVSCPNHLWSPQAGSIPLSLKSQPVAAWGLLVWSLNNRCVASLVALSGKNLPVMWEIQVQPLGREDLLEKGMATHSIILAWEISWTEQPGRLQPMGSWRVWHPWASEQQQQSCILLTTEESQLGPWGVITTLTPSAHTHGALCLPCNGTLGVVLPRLPLWRRALWRQMLSAFCFCGPNS